MSTHRYIDRICCIVLAVTIVITVLFMCGENIGLSSTARAMGYETKLFDTSKVHTIDIIIDDWDSFLETCTDEEYTSCAVKIDNEAFKNVAIRAKGNTSLTQVQSYDSNRYSFKIEFDHYDSGKSYHGLDKLCLNNIIQDNTYMKDYITYRMMYEFGVDSPLCSFVYITVNGEDWGLYLAVEGIEDSFLQRNYGSDSGELYKPDSQSMGGGKGNGENFDMDQFNADDSTVEDSTQTAGNETTTQASSETTTTQNISAKFTATDNTQSDSGGDMGGGNQGMMPDSGQGGFGGGNGQGGTPPTDANGGGASQGTMPDFSPNSSDDGTATGDKPSADGQTGSEAQGTAPDSSQSSDNSTVPDENKTDNNSNSDGNNGTNAPEIPTGGMDDRGGGMGDGGMGGGTNGSDDVSLIYSDDEYSSYENIFDNAKTDITDEDKDRLIASLKKLNENEDISSVVNVEEVIRYFVVHNFVCNFDSYTGSMIHNYYLYEKDGQMSMIPWDYNLAFGGFMGAQNATSLVNYPIDTPVSSGTVDSRPMLAWIFANEEYTELYHSLFSEFIEEYFDNDYIPNLIEETIEMISPYVEKDPTKFCTYEEFETGAETLKEFCILRAESISGQLDGTIPSTSDGQSADSSALIAADNININDMGTMNNDDSQGGAEMTMGGGAQPNGGDSNQNVPDKPSGTSGDPDATGSSDSFDPGGSFGGSPPELPDSNGGGQQPTGAGSDTATDSQTDDGTDSQTDSQNTDGTEPQKPDDNTKFDNGNGDPKNGEGQQAGNTLSKETIILSAASLVVLIVGIVIAFVYKKKN